jgi:hypothetical protein
VKDSFYEELTCMCDKLPKFHMNILLGECNGKVNRENIFTLIIGNTSLQKISNDNGVRVVQFATSQHS